MSAVLRAELHTITQRWEENIRQRVPALGEMERPLLLDHLPELLEALAEWLDSDAEAPMLAALSQSHGVQRVSHGVMLRELMLEYRVLRDVVQAAIAEASAPDEERRGAAADLARLNAGIDYAITLAVESYVETREDAIAALQGRLQLSIDAAGIGTWDFDPLTGYVELDERACQLLHLATDRPLELASFLELIHPEDREKSREAIHAALSPQGTGTYFCEYRVAAFAGTDLERWVAVRGRALLDESGGAVRLIGAMVDVSDRRNLARAQERFLGILGHDLRNPLNAVMLGATRLAQPAIAEADRVRVARMIGSSARRMDALIRDLLDYTMAQAGTKIPMNARWADIDAICRRVIDEVSLSNPGRVVEYRAGTDPFGLWDSERIEQVLSNLIGNALKYGYPEEPVRVRWSRTSGDGDSRDLVLEVENKGEPIADEIRPRLFEPYVKGARVKGASSSVGLGLYIVREVVEAHGGKVNVHSDPERTVFRVTLPSRAPGARLSESRPAAH